MEQSNEALEDFVHSVTHDLRTPLRVGEGYALALIEDYKDELGKDGLDFARDIATSTNDLGKLIQDLLEYSRLSKVEIYQQSVDLTGLMADICKQMHIEIEENGVEMTIDHPMSRLYAHQFALNNAGVNLGDKVHPNVQDNGIGIAPEDHERIFHVFKCLHGTDQYPGSGLGPAIVQKSVERMEGNIGVESEPGKGSCFWIELSKPPDAENDISAVAERQGAVEGLP